jgi:hypothetical protein
MTVYLTRLPATACESDEHPFAGSCTTECAWLADAMRGDGYLEPMIYGDYLGGESSTDWSGCHTPPPMPEERVVYDAVNRAVVLVEEHPDGCMCREDCPNDREALT